jgi:hypothetical protein
MAHHPHIHVTGIKRLLGTRYTADTLSKPARHGIRWKPNVRVTTPGLSQYCPTAIDSSWARLVRCPRHAARVACASHRLENELPKALGTIR